ncbi:hypothetical protein MMIC_P0788 [Mariprofundus micogutta]|uniref:Lipoprotein n=1 Tax=Mariprofundus micogutta TaxID=1921010 RepID=A0A1L8CLM7_9PROT|nr:hypothetical protein [Mariprofundus micogutta]GAV19830.1 hypothetical protein MMIC_P0788 [Mariprofundus micogutta]
MSKLSRIAVLLSAIIFAGCAPKQPNFQMVESPPKAIVQNGYSFTPLDEPEWYIIGRTPITVALAKRGASTDETCAVQGNIFPIAKFESDEAFVAAVKQGQANDADIANPERFKVLTHDVSLYAHKGEPCAFSHIVTEDHAAKKRSKTEGMMILDIYALVCRHPQNRHAAISINYSQRSYAESRDAGIAEKSQHLFNSVEFTTLQ